MCANTHPHLPKEVFALRKKKTAACITCITCSIADVGLFVKHHCKMCSKQQDHITEKSGSRKESQTLLNIQDVYSTQCTVDLNHNNVDGQGKKRICPSTNRK